MRQAAIFALEEKKLIKNRMHGPRMRTATSRKPRSTSETLPKHYARNSAQIDGAFRCQNISDG